MMMIDDGGGWWLMVVGVTATEMAIVILFHLYD